MADRPNDKTAEEQAALRRVATLVARNAPPAEVFAAVTAEADLLMDAGSEAPLARFTELAATAIANTGAQAALTASRARIVAAADETRRRVERDLHDGAQQRLISLALRLRAAQATVPPGAEELVAALEEAVGEATGGAGFIPGSGLTALKDRVEAIGGRFALHSPAGAGTTVEITLPLPEVPA